MPLDIADQFNDYYVPDNIDVPLAQEDAAGLSIWSRVSGGLTDGVTNVFNKVNNSFATGFQQDKITNSITDVLNAGLAAGAQQLSRGIFGGFKDFGENFRRSAVAGFLGTKTGQEISADAQRAQIGAWFSNPWVVGGLAIVVLGFIFLLVRR